MTLGSLRTAACLGLVLSACTSSDPATPGGGAGAGGAPAAGAGGTPGQSGAGGSGGSMVPTAGSGGSVGGTGGDPTAGTGGAGMAGTDPGGAGGGAGTGGLGGGAGGSGGAGGAAMGTVTCGDMQPDLGPLSGAAAEGLVIGPDGTIYVTRAGAGANSRYVGRYAPPYANFEGQWADLGVTGQNFGMTLDPMRNALYVGSRPAAALLRVDLTDASVDEVTDVQGNGGINGVTLGEDGAIYYTDQGGGHVWRVDPDAPENMRRTQVTTQALNGPNGLAFGPDGFLYVVSWSGTDVWKIQVVDGEQVGDAEEFATMPDNNADGIAIDSEGRLLGTVRPTLQLVDTDGNVAQLLGGNVGNANADFGAGALRCTDLYSVGPALFRYEHDTPGLNVPWHRAAP